MRRALAGFAAAVVAANLICSHPAPALAWGLGGHRMIGQAAVANMPDELPAFVRAEAAKDEIVYLQSEEDRLKIGETDERAWTREWTTDHYLDIGDDGMVAGVVSIDALPATRDDFEQGLSHASPPVDAYNVGFLPYAILEGYEQVRSDFALWRLAPPGEKAERERLTIHDIGIFAHFVGDGSQPLHVSVHYNGWGDYPNPHGYTESKKTHADFEDTFVDRYVQLSAVTPLVGAADVLPAIPLAQIGTYLRTTQSTVTTFYDLQKEGAFALSGGSAAEREKGVDFAAHRLAAASRMLDALVLTAWRTSGDLKETD